MLSMYRTSMEGKMPEERLTAEELKIMNQISKPFVKRENNQNS